MFIGARDATAGFGWGEDAIRRYKERIVQAEELRELALAQKLREILAMEQQHAMDLKNALGK